MSALPRTHRRALAACLALLLLLTAMPLAPAPARAQEGPAPAVADAFELTAATGPGDAVFAWTIGQADRLWHLRATRPAPAERVTLQLRDAEGSDLGYADGEGTAALFDLRLSPGTYSIEVRHSGDEPLPFTLAARPEPTRYDPEPNDRPAEAAPLEPGAAVEGRLARTGSDEDVYLFALQDAPDELRDITLESSSASDRQLCLFGADEQRLQCRRAAGRVSLTDLALGSGDYLLRVSGAVDEAAGYRLLVSDARVRAADEEAEPNDDFVTASDFDAGLGVAGRSSLEDEDVHVVSIEGEPQLWRIEAEGPQVDYLRWIRGDSRPVAESRPGCDGSAARIDDLYLVPGDHRFLVRTCEGDYRLSMTPLGPRDPEAEREPNSDDVRAEPYGIGQRRRGRLTSEEDLDYYRFTLAAPEHLRVGLSQAPDSDIRLTLDGGGLELLRASAAEPGAELEAGLWLPPGDYLLELRSFSPSEGVYELTSERLDPFVLPADLEPNDGPGFARPAPASLRWEGGRLGREQDLDGYWLPALNAAGALRIAVEGERPVARLFAGPAAEERVEVEPDREAEGVFVAADPPTGTPLYLELHTEGAYRVEASAPGWTAAEPPAELPLEVSLELADARVAAYWPEGQRVDAIIGLANTGEAPLELALETASSHYAWRLSPSQSSLTLPPASELALPASVEIGPDVWAEAPVRLSVAARAPDGATRTAHAVIDAGRDEPAVGSRMAWPVPDALLGGLDVASRALGAEPSGSLDLDKEPFLYDGVTPAGSGFGHGFEDFPLEISVDLAGDAPLPVAGTILNPLARGSRLDEMVREFELLLSTDGASWQSVLRGELQPIPIDQPFVLEAPVEASHAMLRVHSLHGDGRSRFASLGEWRVIADPAAQPQPMPANIADPLRGGYVARHAPYMNGYEAWYSILDEDARRWSASIDRGAPRPLGVVIGFHEGRAAQISGLRWQDPEGTDQGSRASEVEVEVSLVGPLGPWQRLGTWQLARAADGSVAPFELPEPVWARYVSLRAPLPPEEVREVEFPARVEVLERAPDEEYRSILGAWGYTSDRGPYELLVPSAATTTEPGPDAGDSAADATPLALDEVRADRAEILRDEDWYRIAVPADANSLRLDVAGVPTVGVRLTLIDADGDELELRAGSGSGGSLRYEADVEPGATYVLRVEQPPFNVAFTFDTSGSMGPYLDLVLEGMRVFASDVEPGREQAIIIPFDRSPLLETWTDQPVQLEAAVNDFVPDDESSNIERGLRSAAGALLEREGTRAILAVGDAETGTLDEADEVWDLFTEVGPQVYTVHVGADNQPFETRNLMRAWSDVNGGVYSYPTTHAEMERAFERMSTRLRRPADYALTASAAFVDRTPASLSVVAPPGQPLGLAPDTAIGIILDTSGSMRKRLDGQRRIEIARASLRELLGETIAEGTPVAIRTLGPGGRKWRCRSRLEVPLAPLDRDDALDWVRQVKAPRKAGTPLTDALEKMAGDLEGVGNRIVVVITDGNESCGGDPLAAASALEAEGIETTLNIVGFALDDESLKAQMAGWADATGGSYFDAAGADDLLDAVRRATGAPFSVVPAGGGPAVASGTVGGEAVEVPPGEYVVQVRTEEPVAIAGVVVPAGGALTVELPTQDDD